MSAEVQIGTLTARLEVVGADSVATKIQQVGSGVDQLALKVDTLSTTLATGATAPLTTLGATASGTAGQLAGLSSAASSLDATLSPLGQRFAALDADLARTRAIMDGWKTSTELAAEAAGGTAAPAVTKLGTAASTAAPAVTALGTAATTASGKVSTLTTSTTGLTSSLGQLGPLLLGGGVLLGFQQIASTVLQFSAAVFDNADALVKMSDKTGIGVEALGRLQAVADASGNSIEQIATGVNRMQKAIEEGSKKTIETLSEMGLSIDGLKGLKPEEQFRLIAASIAAIQDPAKQAQLAMELFGRSGADLLPTMKANIQGISDAAVVMSEETARNLRQADIAWQSFKRSAMATAGEFFGWIIQQNKDANRETANTIARLKDLEGVLERLPKAPAAPLVNVGAIPDVPGLPSPEMMDLLDFEFKKLKKSNSEAMVPINAFNAALKTLQGQLSGSDLLQKANEYEIVLGKIGGASKLTTSETDGVIKAYTAVIEKYQQLGPAGASTVEKFSALLAPLTARVASLSESLTAARLELAGLSDTKTAELTTAIQSGAFSMKQLEASTGLSEMALKLFKEQISAAAKETNTANFIFNDYNKKVLELTTALGQATQFDAPIAFVKARFGAMIKSVVEDASILGKTVPAVISDAFLQITIKDGADKLQKEFATFGENLNKQVKSDMERINKEIIKTLGVIIAADDAAAKDHAKFLNQGLANEIKNMEAIGGVTKASLEKRRQLYVQEYQQEVTLLQRKADEEKANLTSSGEQYLAAIAAIDAKTAEEIQLAAQRLNQQFDDMAIKARQWSTKTIDAVSSVASALGSLASSTGSAAGSIIGDVAAIGQALVTAMKAGDEFAKGNYVAGAAQGFTAVNQATASPNTGTNIAGGALAGAAIGATPWLAAATGGWSIVVGALAGAIYGWLKSRANKAFMEEVGRDWGVTITKAMADQIKKDSEDIFKGNRQAGEIFDMGTLIKAAGGLDSSNLDKFTSKLRDTFSMLQTGAFTAAQATKVLDDNWQAFAAAGTDADGRLSAGLKEIIQLDSQLGTNSKAIADYLKGQASDAITGFNAVVAGSALVTQTALDDLQTKLQAAYDQIEKTGDAIGKKGPTALQLDAIEKAGGDVKTLADQLKAATAAAAAQKQSLSDLGIQAVASIGAAVAAGMSLPQALKAAAPALKTLNDAYKALGISTDNAALSAILMQGAILDKNPDLLAAVGGLGQEMVALDNMGLMNADTFAAMERTGAQMYTRLQAAAAAQGGSTRDALLPMQDYLQKAAKEAELLGIPLDANTQSMIDQSKELGIWKKDGGDATSKMIDGMQTLVDKVQKLIDKLTGIPDVNFNVRGRYIPPDLPAGGTPAPPDLNPGFATGTHGRLVDFGPRGTLVTLHNRERVQTEAEVRAAESRPSNVIDISSVIAELKATRLAQHEQALQLQRQNDYMRNTFKRDLARAVRDDNQKAARR